MSTPEEAVNTCRTSGSMSSMAFIEKRRARLLGCTRSSGRANWNRLHRRYCQRFVQRSSDAPYACCLGAKPLNLRRYLPLSCTRQPLPWPKSSSGARSKRSTAAASQRICCDDIPGKASPLHTWGPRPRPKQKDSLT